MERVEDIRTKAKENGFPSQNEAIDLLMNEIVIDGESLAKREEIGKKSLDRKIATIKRLLSTDKNLTDSQKAKLTETAFNYDSLLNESNKDLEASKEADKTETKRESLMTEMGATQSEIDLENEKANTTSEESLELHIIENIEKISTTDLSDSGFTVGVKGKIPLQWVGKNGVNLDEALSSKIGGVVQVRGERPLTDMIMPLTTEFIGDKALLIKQHMDQMKANRVGNQLTSQGLDGDQLAKETATRFTGVEKADGARTEKLARNIAEVFYRKLYEGVAWLVAHHQIDEVEFNVLGKALSANPKNWKYDNNLDTEIGLGAGDSDKIVQNMSGAWQIHSQLKAEGSTLTDEKKGYNILAKMYKSMDIKDVSQIINDPEESGEQLRADNEKLNQVAMQQQQAIEQMSEQIRQLQALSEVETIKVNAKAEADNKKAALEIAKLKENNRQFNVKTLQDGEQHEDNLAFDMTELEIKEGNNTQ